MIQRGWLVLLLLILSGCNDEKVGHPYFPLHEGAVWQYQVQEQLAGQFNKRTFSVQNLGSAELTGEFSGEPVSIRKTSDGTDYYLLQDDTGIYRVARRTVIEYRPRFEEELVRVLPNEADMDVGRSWSVMTKPYALHNSPSYTVRSPQEHKVSMAFEIASLNETVTVPAGQFENCIRVEGIALLPLYTDPKTGYQDIEIKQTEWYAPGVGLVKLVRDEPLETDIFKGGMISFELTRYEMQ